MVVRERIEAMRKQLKEYEDDGAKGAMFPVADLRFLLNHIGFLEILADEPPPELIEKWFQNELHDFDMVLDHLSRTYDHFSRGRITKPLTLPEEVFAVAAELETEEREEFLKEEKELWEDGQ